MQKYLYHESKKTGKPVVFLLNIYLQMSFRHKLKLKNLGQTSLKLLGDVLASASEYGFEFVSVGEYRKLYKV